MRSAYSHLIKEKVMTEQEMMALVNPMKGVAIYFCLAWLGVISLLAKTSQHSIQEDTRPRSYLYGSACVVLAFIIAVPIVLGIQFATVFKGMTIYSAHLPMGGKLFTWAAANLLAGIVFLVTVHVIASSSTKNHVFGYLVYSAAPMVFIVIGLLGLGTLLGVISPMTFYALKLYMQEYAFNVFILLCFIGFGLWMFDIFFMS